MFKQRNYLKEIYASKTFLTHNGEVTPCGTETCFPYSKIHGGNMGPTRVLSAPGGSHDGPMNLAIRIIAKCPSINSSQCADYAMWDMILQHFRRYHMGRSLVPFKHGLAKNIYNLTNYRNFTSFWLGRWLLTHHWKWLIYWCLKKWPPFNRHSYAFAWSLILHP